MNCQKLKIAAAIGAILSLSACAQTQREREVAAPPAMKMEPVSEDGLQPWAVVIEGQPIQELVKDRSKARSVLFEMLGGSYTDEQLAELLARIRRDNTTAAELPEALTGIGGFTTGQLLEAVLAPEGQEQTVRGKIREYYFNDDRKSGYLEVNTVVDTLDNGAVVNTDKYFWAVAVRPGTYEVRDRQGDAVSSPGDPFPGTVTFPAHATNPSDPRSIWFRHLDQKLWAKGKGVVVVAVIKNGVLLPPTNYLYTSTDASCVDLMFWGYPREHELPAQPSYCLGRCDHPQIVNTE